MVFNYSTEKNIQILIALLKAHNIRKVIASPGATNFSLVGSLQSDPFFEIYSSVDERSAAYIACGMAAESAEPVMLSCTGSTASRNYYPGLTEAYYRKLPVLAVTSHQGSDRIGQLLPQNIDRRGLANDIAKVSVELPIIKDQRDEDFAVREVNKALLELKRDGGGPVHINIFTTYSTDFSVKELPSVRALQRFFSWDEMPVIPTGPIAVYVGSHMKFTERQTKAIDAFCATYDAMAICDHTSGYYGKYKLLPTLAQMQRSATSPLPRFSVLVHIGEVSAAVFAGNFSTKEIWRVSEDGEIRDPWKRLTKVFQMPEEVFFEEYSKDGAKEHSLIDKCKEACNEYYDYIPELPFCNIWSAQQLSQRLPSGSLLTLSASNTRRCWNMFPLPENVECTSNVGCCGIDGATSAMLGASLASPNRLCFLATGDLAFFYDMNTIGNRHLGKNIRILLVNNGIGAEFKLKEHYCNVFGDDSSTYMAAIGHFGYKSPELVKNYAEDLGFEYLTASSKDEYMKAVERFVTPEITEKPMLFEIFTNHEDEAEALEMIRNLKTDANAVLRKKAIEFISKTAGQKGIDFIRKTLGK